jgi:signal transduction histidine kinase
MQARQGAASNKMSGTVGALDREYILALEKYLQSGDETALNSAYELGRRAMNGGFGVLDMAIVHRAAVDALIVPAPAADRGMFAHRAADFFHELLSPFEMSLRGYRAANDELQRLNDDLRRQKEAVETANMELESFSYSVSHDLRAPLRAMYGNATALLEDCSGSFDEPCRKYAERIISASERMDTLIQDLLAYSRLTREEIVHLPVELSRVVAEARVQTEETLRESGAELKIDEPLPAVAGHWPVLVQVVTNLLTNAVKFMAPGVVPRVHIWAERRGSRVRLWVEDNGIGIAPEHRERIFKIFERLHSITTYPGTGIGLAIVRKGIERMGGKTGVESELDKGSRFWIELPGPEAQK